MMKQRHSFTRLWYHLVFTTKHGDWLLRDEHDVELLRGFIVSKAPALDAYVEEFGGWRNHVHVLLRSGPVRGLADVYGQLKGFSSHAWNKTQPDRPFGWSDSVFAATVDPDDTQALRAYVRAQWSNHEHRALMPEWEPPEH